MKVDIALKKDLFLQQFTRFDSGILWEISSYVDDLERVVTEQIDGT